MATEIRVPTLGESVTEATIGRWFKKVGEAVAADEPVVELETDKVTIEVPAPAAGVLEAVAAKDGETVGVGALLGTIAAGAGAVAAPAKAEAPKAAAPAPAPAAAAAPAKSVAADANGPAVAKLAAESGVDVSAVAGSGKDGRVTKGDLLGAIAGGATAPAPAAPVQVRAPSPAADAAREERVRMTKLRQTIARRLKDAQNTAAMLTTFNEVDMGAVMALRSQYKDLFEKKHGVKLGFMSFFTKAVIQALKEIPA
ncbi:MAG: 2-oxo acid dehydrogenase subunit E2, partial [Rhizobiales bacterium]|nr:2-oxo acid dehydrogenase subunit E2 [Hyphomicrobiales bacterium]